ncbi:MAG: class I SAM-dependent methyltransferase [Gammaproteobacteria bacterium]
MITSKYTVKSNSDYGFFQISPTPTNEEISKYYADEFYSRSYPRVNNSSLEFQERDEEYNNSRREDMYDYLNRIFKAPITGMNIFDFGCGWGHNLKFFKDRGVNCYGCDPAIEAVDYCQSQGLNVVETKIHTVELFENLKFDVVFLLNVLEHLANPVETIAEIKKKVLKKNGVLILEVPNDFNAFQECAKLVHELPRWWVAPPAHLNYFNRSTLSALLEGEGFEIAHITATFPMELFLLFGENYIKNPELGRACHEKKVTFETNLKKFGFKQELESFYKSLLDANLGRQILVYARSI